MYIVKEKSGNIIAKFYSYNAASEFKFCNGKEDWSISSTIYNRRSTNKQKAAVAFCLNFIDAEFEGDIESFQDCHEFLSAYLDHAKVMCNEMIKNDPGK